MPLTNMFSLLVSKFVNGSVFLIRQNTYDGFIETAVLRYSVNPR